jgi:hypothetical protein
MGQYQSSPHMAFLGTELEFNAFTNLLTASAVNKRLLMRILAHLENRDLKDLHGEVALLNEEFRGTIASELKDLIEKHGGRVDAVPQRPVSEGELPRGREEERRGHALPNDPTSDQNTVIGPPLGRDEKELHGIDDV